MNSRTFSVIFTTWSCRRQDFDRGAAPSRSRNSNGWRPKGSGIDADSGGGYFGAARTPARARHDVASQLRREPALALDAGDRPAAARGLRDRLRLAQADALVEEAAEGTFAFEGCV